MQAERREGRREVEERRLRVHRRDTQRRSDYRREYPRRMIAVSVSDERRTRWNRRADLRRGGVDRRVTESRRGGARRMSFERRMPFATPHLRSESPAPDIASPTIVQSAR